MVARGLGHSVDSVELEFLHDDKRWWLEGEIDIAYMLPEVRNDPGQGALSREGVMKAPPEELARIRRETEKTLREWCKLSFAGKEVAVKFEFPDFDKVPFALPPEAADWALLTTRMVVEPLPGPGVLRIDWRGLEGTELIILDEAGDGRLVSVLPDDHCDLLEVAAPVNEGEAGETKHVESKAGGFWSWVSNGFRHVFPIGLDHILFILGMFLLAPRWKVMAWQSLLFTLAHSVTLALAVFGLVHVSQPWVNLGIALSIAYIGVENLFLKQFGWRRVVLVFGFGLVHGLGYAGGLAKDMQSLPKERLVMPLFGFNLGVECAQVFVIFLAFVLMWPVRKRIKEVSMVGSLLIAIVGLVWFVERLRMMG